MLNAPDNRGHGWMIYKGAIFYNWEFHSDSYMTLQKQIITQEQYKFILRKRFSLTVNWMVFMKWQKPATVKFSIYRFMSTTKGQEYI